MAGLTTYRGKRRFDVTAEPKGVVARKKGHAYVIQKHDATRLHYDLRLELDGVMKSWAVTRGPSLDPNEKRLAVQVEDHPLEYNKFEGTIPKGEYGGGTVMVWDRGTWTPEIDAHKGLKKGHLSFTLDGEKLQGKWHLVRMHRRPGEKRDNWLLIKQKDEAARSARDKDILEEQSLSAKTGRSMDEIAGGTKKTTAKKATPRQKTSRRKTAKKLSAKRKSKRKRAGDPLPSFVAPSLATLSDKAPENGNWIHEIKFDGYRIQARLEDGKVKLLTRKGLDWTRKFPTIAAAIADLPADAALIDGELVVNDAHGVSSFSALQQTLKSGKEPLRRDRDQEQAQAQGAHLYRLHAQQPRGDGGGALLHPRPAGCRGIDADRLVRTRHAEKRRLLHGENAATASRAPAQGSVGGDRARQTKPAEVQIVTQP